MLVAMQQDNLETIAVLDALSNALEGVRCTHSKQRATEWWTYWLEGQVLVVTYAYQCCVMGSTQVYLRERGTFGATLERHRQSAYASSDGTLTLIERETLSLEQSLGLLASRLVQRRYPKLPEQISNIVRFAGRDAHVYLRLSDLEVLTSFGKPETVEGCIYLFSLPAEIGRAA